MSQRKLHISNDLSLPIDAVTQTFADLGIRGSGKTNTATVMFEEMQKLGQQACVIDPVNAWYGVRSSKDGKSPGFKVIVMGGENGDLPLEGSNGSLLADFVIESGASVVFSLRHLSMNDQRQFAQGFAERLYFLKGKSENRSPLHLFVDEADEFIPQRIPKGFERMFGAFDRLVRRGRSSGIGLTMISQRPQVLNKDTLSQCETLICHRLLHQLDRKAVEAWIMAHADAASALDFWQSLATLGKGDAWVWSPEWMDIFKRVHIRARETFDSSFTPKAGERPKTVSKLAEVDLDELKKKLSATIEKAKQDDPRELKREIAELKKAISKQPTGQSVTIASPPKIVEKIVADPKAIRRAIADRDKYWMGAIRQFKSDIREEMDGWKFMSPAINPLPVDRPESVIPLVMKPRSEGITTIATIATKAIAARAESNGKLRSGAERMLAALVQWSPEGMLEGQMRSHAGMKNSGTYRNYLSDLRTAGHIETRGNLMFATQSGLDYFGGNIPASPSSTEEVLAIWKPKLREGAKRILDVLVSKGGNDVALEEVSESSGMTNSGTFRNYLSDLRTARLIVTGRGVAAANRETLFL